MAGLEIIDGDLATAAAGMEEAADLLMGASGVSELGAVAESGMPGAYSPRTLTRVGSEMDQEMSRIDKSLRDAAGQVRAADESFVSVDEDLERSFAEIMPPAGGGSGDG